MSKRTEQATEKAEAQQRIIEVMNRAVGKQAWTAWAGRSASGMTRYVQIYVFVQGSDGKLTRLVLTWNYGKAAGCRVISKEGEDVCQFNGCGYDLETEIEQTLHLITGDSTISVERL